MADISLGTLYEINQNIISKQKPMDPILVNKNIKEISDKIGKGYWMLMCPQTRQYVLIYVIDENEVCKKLRELLDIRGTITDIDRTHENDLVWEFWLKDTYRPEEVVMYQLTSYEVVEV